MKKLLILLIVLITVNLYSADLVNKDSQGYGIEIEQTGTTHTSISGSTTQMGGAPDGATIRIKETGSSIKVSGSRDVIIQNGQLSQ